MPSVFHWHMYSSSFICYSDLRLHCSHISTNKMYIVNTPSPFGLIRHCICIANARIGKDASTIIAWTCGFLFLPYIFLSISWVKKGLRGSFSPPPLWYPIIFAHQPQVDDGGIQGLAVPSNGGTGVATLKTGNVTQGLEQVTNLFAGVPCSLWYTWCPYVSTEMSQRKSMWHCWPENDISMLCWPMLYSVIQLMLGWDRPSFIFDILVTCQNAFWKNTVNWRQSFPSAVYSAYTVSTFSAKTRDGLACIEYCSTKL